MPAPPKPIAIHVQRYGSATGVPIVLLHGYPYDGRIWDASAKSLAALGYPVFVPDLRGFGKSPKADDMSMQAMACDVSAYLEGQGVKNAVIVGFSMGGYVAMQMGIRHREQVAGLVLVATRAEADAPSARAGREALAKNLGAVGMQAAVDAMLAAQLHPETRATRPGVEKLVRDVILAQDAASSARGVMAMADRPDVRGKLAGLNMACLVIAGEDDPVISLDSAVRLAQHFRGSEFSGLAKAAHAVMLDQPERFVATLREWLKRTYPS